MSRETTMTEKPGGRPGDPRDAAARFTDEALATLVALMRESTSDQVRIAAARELLDRAHGKPKAEAGGDRGPGLAELVARSYGREE
jgi:hypothetical protein